MAFVCAVAETALMLAVGMVLFGVELPTDARRWALFVAIFVLGVAACSLIGIAFGILARTAKSAAAIVNPPFIVLQFISGVWIPEAAAARGPAGAGRAVPAEVDGAGVPLGVPPRRLRQSPRWPARGRRR